LRRKSAAIDHRAMRGLSALLEYDARENKPIPQLREGHARVNMRLIFEIQRTSVMLGQMRL